MLALWTWGCLIATPASRDVMRAPVVYTDTGTYYNMFQCLKYSRSKYITWEAG